MKRLAAALAALALAACAHAAPDDVAPASAESDIRAALQHTADAWNAGDLDGHVSAYSDTATMMGSRGLIHGRDSIEAGLRRGFWQSGRAPQALRYEDVQVRMLGARYALVTGRCVLSGGGRPDYSCRFSLTWALENGRWVMIHDHSS